MKKKRETSKRVFGKKKSIYTLVSNAVLLIIAVKPEIADTTDDDVIVVEGRRLTLTCQVVTGSPTPSVTWYINGSLAADMSRSPMIDRAAGTLTVQPSHKADTGRYTCVAANAAGNDVIHFHVHVIGRCHVISDSFGVVVSALVSISLVALRLLRLLPGWVTVGGQVEYLGI